MQQNKNIRQQKKVPVAKVTKNNAVSAKKEKKPAKNLKSNALVNNVKAQIKEAKEKQTKNKTWKAEPNIKKEEVPAANMAVLDATEATKIEKKKAKKVAKKLKKEQNKKAQMEGRMQAKLSPNEDEHQRRDPALDASTVFVGNLPISTKRVQIVKIFAKFGGVNGIRLRTAAGQVIFKHKQRKQAGSLNAYVVLNSPEAAQKALALNGNEFKGVHLRVTPSDSEKNRKGHDPKRTVFVGNLTYNANEEKLRDIFSNCGEIDYIRCLYDGKNKCKGVGYVCFKSPEAVGLALELNETVLDERPIHVERYSTKKLGAKEARDKAANTSQKPAKSGAKKRIDAKKGSKGAPNESKEKKKSEFRGVKVSGIKKKNNKKVTSEMKTIAKKIAPKTQKS